MLPSVNLLHCPPGTAVLHIGGPKRLAAAAFTPGASRFLKLGNNRHIRSIGRAAAAGLVNRLRGDFPMSILHWHLLGQIWNEFDWDRKAEMNRVSQFVARRGPAD